MAGKGNYALIVIFRNKTSEVMHFDAENVTVARAAADATVAHIMSSAGTGFWDAVASIVLKGKGTKQIKRWTRDNTASKGRV